MTIYRFSKVTVFVVATIVIIQTECYSQKIALKNRTIDAKPGIQQELTHKLKNAELYPVHGIVQLYRMPTSEDRFLLSEAGVELKQFLGSNAYIAAFSKGSNVASVQKYIRYGGLLTVQDKIDDAILDNTVDDWALTKKGAITILISFFDEFKSADVERLLSEYNSTFQRHGPGLYKGELTRAKILEFAGNEMVRWIEPGPLPMMPLGD